MFIDWVRAAGGSVTAEASEAFSRALDDDPGSVGARYYLALADAQRGDTVAAAEALKTLIEEAPADAPYVPQFRQIGERALFM